MMMINNNSKTRRKRKRKKRKKSGHDVKVSRVRDRVKGDVISSIEGKWRQAIGVRFRLHNTHIAGGRGRPGWGEEGGGECLVWEGVV